MTNGFLEIKDLKKGFGCIKRIPMDEALKDME